MIKKRKNSFSNKIQNNSSMKKIFWDVVIIIIIIITESMFGSILCSS